MAEQEAITGLVQISQRQSKARKGGPTELQSAEQFWKLPGDEARSSLDATAIAWSLTANRVWKSRTFSGAMGICPPDLQQHVEEADGCGDCVLQHGRLQHARVAPLQQARAWAAA